MPSNSNAFFCRGVGSGITTKRCSESPGIATSLRQKVARSLARLFFLCRMRSSPRFLETPSAATTCPWGNVRFMEKASFESLYTTAPFRMARMPSTIIEGTWVRLHSVFFLILFPSRLASRRSMAPGLLGTITAFTALLLIWADKSL